MLKGTAELDNQATAKTFVPSETLHSCQQADATGSSTPRPLSNGRWGARCRQWLDHPWRRLSRLTAHVFSGRPIRNRGWGRTKTVRRCASQLAPSASQSWNGAGFLSNSMGDHQRQKAQASCPGRDQSAARHGYFFCFTLLPKLAFLSGQICPKVLNQDFTFLEKTLESPLDCGEIQPVHPRRNQPRIFIGRTDAEAEGPVLCPPDVKSQLIWKDPDAGKDWRQEEKGVTEDEMVGWHHQLNGHEPQQTPGDSGGQRSLVLETVQSQRVRRDLVT